MTCKAPSGSDADCWMNGGISVTVRGPEDRALNLPRTSQTTHGKSAQPTSNPAPRQEGPGPGSLPEVCGRQLGLLSALSFWKVHGDCPASLGAKHEIWKKPGIIIIIIIVIIACKLCMTNSEGGAHFFFQILQSSV